MSPPGPLRAERPRITKLNPATLEKVGEVEESSPEDIPLFLSRAREAQAEWVRLPIKRRLQVLQGVQAHIAANLDEFARTICEETGKPRLEALNADLLSSLSAGKYSMDEMKVLFRPRRLDFGFLGLPMRYLGRSSYIQPRPVGVVGVVAPWNYPFGIPFSQAVMAVAAGNAVILKPSSETPLTALRIQEAFRAGGIPEHLVQVVVGPGRTVGNALITSGVDRIIFTGSTEVGRKVMEMAAQRLTPVTLELGGKDPFIVFDDADLERAADGAVWGAFVNAGQTCVCVKRIYVQEKLYPAFLEAFKQKVSTLRLGYGWDDPAVSMGPLMSEAAVREMEAHVARAIEQGGEVLVGGRRRADLRGHFFEPTAIVNVPQDADVVQKEIFGPIVAILPFRTEGEAVTLANDCPFALAGSVWTSDLRKGRRVAEAISSGTVAVNNVAYTYGLASTPWGGKGESGFGRTHGDFGFWELMEPHHVHMDKGRFRREIWWSPYDAEGTALSKDLIELAFRGRYGLAASVFRRARKRLKGRRPSIGSSSGPEAPPSEQASRPPEGTRR